MKVLFIGGTGIISSACTELAVQRGIEMFLLNRGMSNRPVPDAVNFIHGDINDPGVSEKLAGIKWDAVVDWIAFTPEEVQRDIDLFRWRTSQYIFISSASVYQTPPSHLPVTESTVLDNPYWAYSRNKIACEELLVKAYREEKFPMTIVRPSHTYDRRSIPLVGGATTLRRMIDGRPVLVIGDGTSIWTLTHNKDFAKGFVPLLGHPGAVGQIFHITSDEWLTWNQIVQNMGQALGVEPRLVHAPSDLIAAYDPQLGAGLLGDKMHSMIFDNSKIKRFVPDFNCTIPFTLGAREIAAWHTAEPSRIKEDRRINDLMDQIITHLNSVTP